MEFLVEDGQKDIREQLRGLAQDVVAAVTAQDAEDSQELLGMFVTELFLSATQQSIRKERSKRQRKAVADAMARGVQFGAKRRPLPENFDEVRRMWRSHEMNLKEAAKLCGMPTTTFYDAVRRAEQEQAAS